MMEYVRNNLFLPGQVENWIIMIDLDNLSLMSVPFKVNYFCDDSILEFETFDGHSLESVPMHLSQSFYSKRIYVFQYGMVDSERVPTRAH